VSTLFRFCRLKALQPAGQAIREEGAVARLQHRSYPWIHWCRRCDVIADRALQMRHPVCAKSHNTTSSRAPRHGIPALALRAEELFLGPEILDSGEKHLRITRELLQTGK